jgi:hypothetical protein
MPRSNYLTTLTRTAFVVLALCTTAAVCPNTGKKGAIGSITATTKRNQLGGEITIVGTGFPAGHTIRFEYRNVPNVDGAFSPGLLVTVDPTGNFKITDTEPRCRTRDNATQWPNVLISAIDSSGTSSENPVTTISPSIWICP